MAHRSRARKGDHEDYSGYGSCPAPTAMDNAAALVWSIVFQDRVAYPHCDVQKIVAQLRKKWSTFTPAEKDKYFDRALAAAGLAVAGTAIAREVRRILDEIEE